jgi:hypothetical protein
MSSRNDGGWLAMIASIGMASLVIGLSILWGRPRLAFPALSPESRQRLEQEARQRLDNVQKRNQRTLAEIQDTLDRLATSKEKLKEPEDGFFERQRRILMEQAAKTDSPAK